MNISEASIVPAVPAAFPAGRGDLRPSIVERICLAVKKIFASIAYWLTLPFQKQMNTGEFNELWRSFNLPLTAQVAENQYNAFFIPDKRTPLERFERDLAKETQTNIKSFNSHENKELLLYPVIVNGTFSGNHIVLIAYSKKDNFLWFFDSKGRDLEDKRNWKAKKIWNEFKNQKADAKEVINDKALQHFFDGHSCGTHVLRAMELLSNKHTPKEVIDKMSSENIEETRSGYYAKLPELKTQKNKPPEMFVKNINAPFALDNELP